MTDFPSITVVIAARPDEKTVLAAEAARKLDYPRERLEILIARGRQPSVQRNKAVQAARGDYILFLDDDSVPDACHLQLALQSLRQEKVAGVGGPNLCPDAASHLEHSFAAVMGNKLAFGPSAARYRSLGQRRPSDEKELILCNLVLHRESFLRAGGFDEALYPNEENALMDALVRQGGILVYDPDLSVRRAPRKSWASFARMVFTYGRGRAEQFRRHPGWNSLLNFVPPLFCLYLTMLPLLPRWCFSPLALYLPLTLVFALISPRHPTSRLPAIWMGLVLTHLGYGIGFWRGLFTRIGDAHSDRAGTVVLERLAL